MFLESTHKDQAMRNSVLMCVTLLAVLGGCRPAAQQLGKVVLKGAKGAKPPASRPVASKLRKGFKMPKINVPPEITRALAYLATKRDELKKDILSYEEYIQYAKAGSCQCSLLFTCERCKAIRRAEKAKAAMQKELVQVENEIRKLTAQYG